MPVILEGSMDGVAVGIVLLRLFSKDGVICGVPNGKGPGIGPGIGPGPSELSAGLVVGRGGIGLIGVVSDELRRGLESLLRGLR